MGLFVVLYVWQNIEIMKIKLEYKNFSKIEKQLAKDKDQLLYEIERYRKMDVINDFARKTGLKQINPDDFDVMVLNENSPQ